MSFLRLLHPSPFETRLYFASISICLLYLSSLSPRRSFAPFLAEPMRLQCDLLSCCCCCCLCWLAWLESWHQRGSYDGYYQQKLTKHHETQNSESSNCLLCICASPNQSNTIIQQTNGCILESNKARSVITLRVYCRSIWIICDHFDEAPANCLSLGFLKGTQFTEIRLVHLGLHYVGALDWK